MTAIDAYISGHVIRHAEPQHRAALDAAAAKPVSIPQPVNSEWSGMLGKRVTIEEGIGARRNPAALAEQQHRIKTVGEEYSV